MYPTVVSPRKIAFSRTNKYIAILEHISIPNSKEKVHSQKPILHSRSPLDQPTAQNFGLVGKSISNFQYHSLTHGLNH